MKLLTIYDVPGKKIEALGMVKGATVQAKHVGKDLLAGLKGVVGGELKGYTEMLADSREIATERMIAEAKALGADAIIGIRYSSSAIMEGASEVLAYGTAVKYLD